MSTQHQSRGVEGQVRVPPSPTLVQNQGQDADPGHISISLGYLAEAMRALIEAQEDYVTLDQIQRKTNVLILQNQQGPGGTIMAQANAITNSADADATNCYYDAGKDAAQAASSLVNFGASAYQTKSEKANIGGGQDDLNNATQMENQFGIAPQGDGVAGNVDIENEQEILNNNPRLNALLNGEGPPKFEDGDEEQLSLIKSKSKWREKFAARINQAKTDANTKIHSGYIAQQTRANKWQAGAGLVQSGVSAALDAEKGVVDKDKKGPNDALRVVAGASDQTLVAAGSNGEERANKAKQEGDKINDIRVALGSNNGTAGH